MRGSSTRSFSDTLKGVRPSLRSEKNLRGTTCNFYGREFFISGDVLIPRPETEQVIDAVLNLAGKPYLPGVKPGPRRLPEHPVILDVGTGSGCIAVTLAKELPEATVYASDVSEAAIKVAQKNAALHGASVTFIISYLLDFVNGGSCRLLSSPKNGTCIFGGPPSQSSPVRPDIIVANLPYVDSEWEWVDKEALSREPSIALYAEDHGLKLIKELIDTANAKYLILEADPCQHTEIIEYAKKKGFNLTEVRGYIVVLKASKMPL